MAYYDLVKALHIISMVALMASLLIYPRYKIHQLSSAPGEAMFETLKTASNQLKKIIMNPALIATWVFGLTMLAMNPNLFLAHWMQVKLVFVVLITGLHGIFLGMGKKIDQGVDGAWAQRLRMLNEVPFVLMIGIVIMAVVEPF
jgi:putative membrane protein